MKKLFFTTIIGFALLGAPLTADASNGVGTYKNDYQVYLEFYEFYEVHTPSEFTNHIHYILGSGYGLFRSLVIDNETRKRVLERIAREKAEAEKIAE